MDATPTKADERQILDSLHDFIRQEIMPLQAEIQDYFDDPKLYYEADGRECQVIVDARRRTREAAAKAGFYTMCCPAEFGGADLGYKIWYLCWESIFATYGAPVSQLPYHVLSHFVSGPHEVWKYATPELKEQVLPDVISGKLQGCFGLSEPDAGSDSWMMRTTAVRDGDDWIINGSKQWISWSPTADFIMVYAVTDKKLVAEHKGGISCFYLPTSTPGFKVESVLKMFGSIGGKEAILSFTEARVPNSHLVGQVDRGFDLAMLGVLHGRLANVGRAMGLARWSLEKTIEYTKIRKVFDKTLSEHQTIQNYLAESLIKLFAGRTMALDCCTKLDAGRKLRAEVSMLKVYGTQAAFEIIDRCMQIHGAMGLTNEVGLYEAWHNARLTHITEGPNEIQKRSIAKELYRGNIDLTFE